MRTISVTILNLLVPFLLLAQQSIAPSVNNLAGIDAKVNEILVSTSIGEPAIITLETSQNSITQGFLQPELLPCVDLEFNLFPNPTAETVTIEAMGCEVGIQSIQIIDLWGRLIDTLSNPKENKINLIKLADGVYILRIILTNNDIHTVSVVKNTP